MPKKNATAVKDHASAHGIETGEGFMPANRALQIHRIMVRARAMEERMIKMSKSGQGFFWIGGPGEEAFNSCLGLQIKKGSGPEFDYLHLKYRAATVMVAMGMDPLDNIRQMAMRVTDPFSMGRNFPSHFSRKAWNVIPVTPVIEVQFAVAPGTAIVQKRLGGDGVTIVVGGESGSAEGDFASCMIWSTRPGNELPVLMITMNNSFGISTPQSSQHHCEHTVERGKAFGIPGEVVDGNDVVASWCAIERALHHCRNERKPYMLEAMVSRLYGHSSSSGAPKSGEADCISLFEAKLLDAQLIDHAAIDQVHEDAHAEVDAAVEQAMKDAMPVAADVEKFTYADSAVDRVYPGDYTGLPR